MPEEKKERWLTYLATTTVVLAVLATLSTFFGQKNSTKAVISEIRASNQWGYYQAKKIRSYLFEVQKENLDAELEAQSRILSGEARKQVEQRRDAFGLKIEKWEKDMSKISTEARTLEKARDEAFSHGKNFGVAVVFLQTAILLSSIAALMKIKPVWVSGLIVGLFGAFYFFNGFVLFV